MGPFTISSRFEGIAGIGQGGHLAGILAEELGSVTRVDFRSPIPLEHPLSTTTDKTGIVVWDGDTRIAEAAPSSVTSTPPPPVTTEQAERARRWAVDRFVDRVRTCFSCGSRPDSLGVHAGRVDGTDLFATPYTPPAWTSDHEGDVRHRFLWAPLDCAAGWRVALDAHRRLAVTGWLTVEIFERVPAGAPLVVVADADDGWNERKRHARSALYSDDGRLLAASESLWISVPDHTRS